MKKAKNAFMAAVALGLLFTSCKKVILDAGDLTTEIRDLDGEFTEIKADGSLDIYVGQYEDEIRIEAGEKLMEHIETYVQNGTLFIDEESSNFLTSRPRRVFVDASFLDRIQMDGSGDLEAENISSEDFQLDIEGSGDSEITFSEINTVVLDLQGSGDCKFTGNGDSMYIGLNGSGDVSAKQFQAETAVVNVNGSGDVDVFASESITININGSGDVSYWGNPADTNFNINGSGDINQIN